MCIAQVTVVHGTLSPKKASTSYRCAPNSLMIAQSFFAPQEAQQPPHCLDVAMQQPLVFTEKLPLKSVT